ncbi:MAG: hypothetical protein QF752_17220 [Planctomycetota bacterium]|nr:hypothetical protein [Planctomycetota bacterium]
MNSTRWNSLVRWIFLGLLVAMTCGNVQSQDSGNNRSPWNPYRVRFQDTLDKRARSLRHIRNLTVPQRSAPEGYEWVTFRGTLRSKNLPDREALVESPQGNIRVFWWSFLPSYQAVNVPDYVEVNAVRRIAGNNPTVYQATIRRLRPSVPQAPPAPCNPDLRCGARTEVVIRGLNFVDHDLIVELCNGHRVNVRIPHRISGDPRDLWRDAQAYRQSFRLGARVRLVVEGVSISPRNGSVSRIYVTDILVR